MVYLCKSMKRLITFLLGLVLLGSAAPAKTNPYAFRHYSTLDGLSSNSVRAILQDHRGIIWIGTSDGLDSFDGKEAIHHPIPGGNSSYVQALLEDASHTIWVGTDDAVYRLTGDVLTPVPGMGSIVATCFVQTPDGCVWMGTYGSGLFCFENGSFTSYLEGNDIEHLYVGLDGRLWVADSSMEGGLLLFNASTRQFLDPGLSYIDCTPTRVCAIDRDNNGDIWLGTWDSGLYRIDRQRKVHLAVPPMEGLNHVHTLAHDASWNFLVGSDDGLLHVAPLSGETVLYRNDRSDPSSLSNKFVYPIVTDHEGGIWIGTYYGGINYLSPTAGQFLSVSLSKLADASEDYIASCFCEEPDGTIWIGSDNGGLFRYDPALQSVSRLKMPFPWEQRLASYNIHALYRLGDDLWIGTYSDNLLRLNLKTRQVREYDHSRGLDARSVYTLAQDYDGTLWAGTNTGLCRYDAATDRFVKEKAANWTNGCALAPDGSLWFATARGGILQRSRRGVWEEYTTQSGGFPTNYVNCLLATPSGIFAGTQKGLALISEGRVSMLVKDQDIQGIAQDGRHLWLTTQASIIRYSTADGQTEEFGANDGVRASLFTPNASLVARDGRIYMGTADGFVSFYPGSIRKNAIAPHVVLTRFNASGRGLSQNVLASQQPDKVKLSWRYSDLQITFAAPSYCAPEKVRYQYRLEGKDDEWIDLGNQNKLTLSKLPAEHYRLFVKACNNSGVWSEETELASFTIREHPLRSNLAVVLYTILAFLLVWLLLRWQISRTERKSRQQYAQQLDTAVTQVKEEELDDRVQLLTSLSEQLEAPVTGIGLQLEKVKAQPKAKEALAVLEKNHRMLRSIVGNLRQMRYTLERQLSGEAPVAPVTPDEEFISRLDGLIADHLADPNLSVGFLAQEMAISRSSLFSKTKELTGETPNNLINQARLNLAANLLAEGRYNVGEICYMAGFSSPSYFSKIFVSQYGITPHEWAKKAME